MSRLKAVYRSWAIPCAGRDVYYARHRAEWLAKIPHAGVRRRAAQRYTSPATDAAINNQPLDSPSPALGIDPNAR